VPAERDYLEVAVILPHEIVAEVDCCGCLIAIRCGDKAEIRCNECDALIDTVSARGVRSNHGEALRADVGGSGQRTVSALWGVECPPRFLVDGSLYLQGMRRRRDRSATASMIASDPQQLAQPLFPENVLRSSHGPESGELFDSAQRDPAGAAG
jgi:hypothetical protein